MTYSISVLSAVRNEAEHIDDMMSSVLSETGIDIELIFADDGSSDRTVDLIQRRAKLDNRIKLVGDGKHRGKVESFNLAFSYSNNDVICLLAGDDRFPAQALRHRTHLLQDAVNSGQSASLWGKLRTFSDDPSQDGLLIPRGSSVSRSGASITMTRLLANRIFPIPGMLPNEDGWLSFLGQQFSQVEILSPKVFAEYRIHPGNSNPRGKPFEQFSKSMDYRNRFWNVILREVDGLSVEARLHATQMAMLERSRRSGNLLQIATIPRISFIDRIAHLSMATPILYNWRQRLFRFTAGIRER